ncbi:alpha-1,2-fucosyltransferase [Cecembia lonarensis]|uniref:Glycosyl transferase family 11 n=1 Tax=Cecembia lonarensis (strain CCUG 58316 / KCTC 22772 / LW9) TaxID=1225176 RepID=K1KX93_CECL9|nr:alpha-1,2-fucosyltransferase [Cecembia lonarensis]EKB48710.1 Glycosyl transferase family 11 [Cecembia lonarensis LW9]
MIIMKFMGGLGNQIYQYALGRKLSELHNSFLASDIHIYKNDPDREFVLDKFNIKVKHLPWKVIKLLNSDYALKFDKVFHTEFYHELVLEKALESKDIPRKNNLYLRGSWGNRKYYEDYIDKISDEITLKEKFKTKDFNTVNKKVKNSDSVGIHIRRGDYEKVAHFKNFYGLLPPSYYSAAVDFIGNRIEKSNFFIFSDDTDWVKENLPFLKDSFFVSDIIGSVDYLEFELLKNCKHQIIANSTFSWWAARLNSNPAKIVIKPKRWFADDRQQAVYEIEDSYYIKEAIKL